jgi:DNA-binding CsgD family transcriptional regulator
VACHNRAVTAVLIPRADLALLAAGLVALAVALGALAVAQGPGRFTTYADRSGLATALTVVAGLALVVAGLVTAFSRRAGRIGDLAVLAGLVWSAPVWVGYLLKERVFDIATVVDALRRIVDGETVIDPTIVSRLVGRRRREDPLADLSEREREVLGLIAEGMSNRAIAARLYVTERTVEAHVTQIFQKLRLPESPDQPRRGLAVLAFLRA